MASLISNPSFLDNPDPYTSLHSAPHSTAPAGRHHGISGL